MNKTLRSIKIGLLISMFFVLRLNAAGVAIISAEKAADFRSSPILSKCRRDENLRKAVPFLAKRRGKD